MTHSHHFATLSYHCITGESVEHDDDDGGVYAMSHRSIIQALRINIILIL